jgi:hypothetical protein
VFCSSEVSSFQVCDVEPTNMRVWVFCVLRRFRRFRSVMLSEQISERECVLFFYHVLF